MLNKVCSLVVLIVETKWLGRRVFLSTLACGGSVEMELRGLEGWVSRLGLENRICQSVCM